MESTQPRGPVVGTSIGLKNVMAQAAQVYNLLFWGYLATCKPTGLIDRTISGSRCSLARSFESFSSLVMDVPLVKGSLRS